MEALDQSNGSKLNWYNSNHANISTFQVKFSSIETQFLPMVAVKPA
jgi:hypothetical protein